MCLFLFEAACNYISRELFDVYISKYTTACILHNIFHLLPFLFHFFVVINQITLCCKKNEDWEQVTAVLKQEASNQEGTLRWWPCPLSLPEEMPAGSLQQLPFRREPGYFPWCLMPKGMHWLVWHHFLGRKTGQLPQPLPPAARPNVSCSIKLALGPWVKFFSWIEEHGFWKPELVSKEILWIYTSFLVIRSQSDI